MGARCMNIFMAILLGIVQGVTEFLPISSSGHLVIFQEIFGLNDLEESHLLFDIMLHVGTVISICLVYRKDFYQLIKAFFEMLLEIPKGKVDIHASVHRKMILLIIVATIPAVLVGVMFKGFIEEMFKSIQLVGVMLLITGLFLWLTNKIVLGKKEEQTTKYKNAFVVGIFQSFAMMPGISRSGSTIVGGLLVGLKKEFAVKLSFFMLVPATLGAAVLHIPDVMRQGFKSSEINLYLVGTVVAAITGFFAIKILIKILNQGKLYLFSYYCWAVAAAIFVHSWVMGS